MQTQQRMLSIFVLLLTYFSIAICEVPQAPVLKIINKDRILEWTVENTSLNIEVGSSTDINSTVPDSWIDSDTMLLDQVGILKVFARADGSNQLFTTIYDVREDFPAAAGQENSSAVHMDDESILGWASSVHEVTYGTNVDSTWMTPEKALGQAVGTSFDIVCLGEGGEISLEFEPAISNGNGYDFCVFENSFNLSFLEIAFVEVSSDGENFVRFDNVYLGEVAVSPYGGHDTKEIGSLAGKYMQGYGNPLDLEVLKNKPQVLDGTIDLKQIKYVKIVDIIGDGNTFDSFNHVIYDPYPSTGSAGFDLDAIGVMNQYIEPPANFQISGDGTNILLQWDELAKEKGTTYSVYSSSNPYSEYPSEWALEKSGIIGTSWSEPISQNKKFYIVTKDK